MDDRDLRTEAAHLVKEIQCHVSVAKVSELLESSFSVVHMNIKTKDNILMCVRLTVRGFDVSLLS